MLLSFNVAGLPFIGSDSGGFFGNPNAELMTRWFQARWVLIFLFVVVWCCSCCSSFCTFCSRFQQGLQLLSKEPKICSRSRLASCELSYLDMTVPTIHSSALMRTTMPSGVSPTCLANRTLRAYARLSSRGISFCLFGTLYFTSLTTMVCP